MKLLRSSLALALLAGALGVVAPVVVAPTPAAAAPASASGELDYDDQSGGSIGDYDLGYTVTVSNTTPQVGDNVTVTISWDENGADPWGYSDVNLCWDAPPGWAAAGGPPATQGYSVTTTEDTPVSGQVVGTDVPAVPPASSNFADGWAVGERTDVTSYQTPAGRVYRFCAHADSIDERTLAILDGLDSIHGSMTVTLEAPRSGPAQFNGLLPTASYVGDPSFHGGVPRRFPAPLAGGYGLPADPDYEALVPPRSPGSLSQTTGGSMGVVRYDHDGDGDNASSPITVTPTGTMISYALHQAPSFGIATVNADGTWSYLPASGYIGQDSFKVRVSDGDGFSLSTVTVTVTEGTTAMTVTKRAAQTSVLVGEPIDYEIEVAATGSLPLRDVVVTDPNAPDCDTTIARITQQSSTVVECTYTPTAEDLGTYTNVATATVAALPEPVSSNPVDVTVEAAATPRLEIQKSTTQRSVEAGGTITYELEVTNTGGVPLTGVVVTDANAPACARTVGNLAPGARSVWSCGLVTTGAMVGNRGNVAVADSDQTDPVGSGDVVVEVMAADAPTTLNYTCTGVPVQGTASSAIAITGEDDVDPAEPGRPVNWTFRVANPSLGEVPLEITVDYLEVEYDRPANLDGVSLALVNPPGQTANPPPSQANPTVTASKVRFRTPTNGDIVIRTNGTMTYNGSPVVLPQIRVTGTPTEAARGTDVRWNAPRVIVRASAPVVGSFTITCSPPTTTVVSTRVNPAIPILDIDKSSVQQAAMPGQTIQYELVVRNRGNVGLTGVVVDDPLAPDCNRTLGALAAGVQETITCSRLVGAGDLGRLRNLATADSDQTDPVTSNPADVVVGTEAVAGLDVRLTAGAESVPAGGSVPWSITVRNTGNAALSGLVLDADDASDCEVQAAGLAGLAAGDQVVVDCTTPAALPRLARGGTVANQVTVTAAEAGPVTSEARSVAVTIPRSPWPGVGRYQAAADWLDHWDVAGGARFRGGAVLTRGELADLLYRLAGRPTVEGAPTMGFTDVPRVGRAAVRWATLDPDGAGPLTRLLGGVSATRFKPNAAATRGVVVQAVFRLGQRLAAPVVPDPIRLAFTDVPRSLRPAVAWATTDPDGSGPDRAVMAGVTRTRFKPSATITRGGVAGVLHRAAEVLDL